MKRLVSIISLSILITYSSILSEQVRIALANPFGGYHGLGTAQWKIVQSTEAKNLVTLYSKLDYTHVLYSMYSPAFYSFYKDSTTGKWQYYGDFDNMHESAKRMHELLSQNGIQMIPMLPSISHEGTLFQIAPSASEIKQDDSLVVIRTNYSDRFSSGDTLITVTATTPIPSSGMFMYIAHDRTIQKKPQWLKSKFKEINEGRIPITNNNNSREMEIWISKDTLQSGQSIVLGGNIDSSQNYPSDANMYLIFLSNLDQNGLPSISVDQTLQISRVPISNQRVEVYSDINSWYIGYNVVYPDGRYDYKNDVLTLLTGWEAFKYTNPGWPTTSENDYFNQNVVIKMGDNPDFYQIFEEYVKIFKNNIYTSGTKEPEYIHLGDDELGWGCFCLLAVSKNKMLQNKKDSLVADCIHKRIQIVDKWFTSKPKLLLWGDSYTDGDYGKIYGLIDQQNGVLARLKKIDSTYVNRIIIMPWMYSWDNNERRAECSDLFNRDTSIAYIVSQGYKFITTSGEDAHLMFSNDVHDSAYQCTYEACVKRSYFQWNNAAQKYYSNCAGFGYATWVSPLDSTGSTHQSKYHVIYSDSSEKSVNYSSSFLTYLNLYPYIGRYSIPNYNNFKTYFDGLFSGVDYHKSRNELDWDKGVHYGVGLALSQIGRAKITTGTWEDIWTKYKLTGKTTVIGADVWGTADDCIFALMEHNGDFHIDATIENMTNAAKCGLMVRESTSPGSKCLYLHYNTNFDVLALHQRITENGPIVPVGSSISVSPSQIKSLRVQRTGADSISCSVNVDNLGWQKIGDVALSTSVITGFALTATIDTPDGSATFTNVSISKPDSTESILGFENAKLWSFVNGTNGILTINSNYKTEGFSSLNIIGNGFQQISSVALNTTSLNEKSKLMVDIFVGATQPNPFWIGQLQLYVNCPSAGVHNQYIGAVELSQLSGGDFNVVEFLLPPNILSVLQGEYNDFSLSFGLNTSLSSGPYSLDRIRFSN